MERYWESTYCIECGNFRRRGSRVRIYLNNIRAVFHRPYPGNETDKGALKSMRRFLIEAGVSKIMLKYKRYTGYVEYDDEAKLFHGALIFWLCLQSPC